MSGVAIRRVKSTPFPPAVFLLPEYRPAAALAAELERHSDGRKTRKTQGHDRKTSRDAGEAGKKGETPSSEERVKVHLQSILHVVPCGVLSKRYAFSRSGRVGIVFPRFLSLLTGCPDRYTVSRHRQYPSKHENGHVTLARQGNAPQLQPVQRPFLNHGGPN